MGLTTLLKVSAKVLKNNGTGFLLPALPVCGSGLVFFYPGAAVGDTKELLCY